MQRMKLELRSGNHWKQRWDIEKKKKKRIEKEFTNNAW